jgi:hypothetical protein
MSKDKGMSKNKGTSKNEGMSNNERMSKNEGSCSTIMMISLLHDKSARKR